MAKINLYGKIKKDLENAIDSKNAFFKANLKNLISRIDDLKNISDKEMTNEDVLIVLKDVYNDVKKKANEEPQINQKYSDDIDKLIDMFKGYFVYCGYNIEDFYLTELSNGINFDVTTKEIGKKNEALEIKNTISSALFIVGIIDIVISFILGFALGSVNYEFSFAIAIVYWLAGGISGLMIIGFSEIIKLLHDIRRKLYKKD